MRGRPIGVLVALVTLMVALPSPASAEPQEGDVVAEGEILLGVPFAEAASLILYGDPTTLGGPHAFTFDAAALEGLWLWPQVQDNAGAGFLVGIHFIDADDQFIETDCANAPGSTALATEPYGELGVMIQCLVPPGTVTAYVYAGPGALLDVTVVVAAPPPGLPEGVLAEQTLFAGAPMGQQALWWFGGTDMPTVFSVRADVSGLAGERLLTDVADGGGVGYDIRLRFFGPDGAPVSADCMPMPGAAHPVDTGDPELRWSESCIVPSGATRVEAVAEHGHAITVTLRIA